MTDIVESLEHLARLKSLSGQAGHARMAMNVAAAEIKQLRAALEPFAKISRAHPQWAADDPAYIEIDDGLTVADFHRANAVLGQSREQAMQELADQAQALDMGYGQATNKDSK